MFTFFSYFGAKSKLVNNYPIPKYPSIIEPFAGAACYSVKYFELDCVLRDTDDNVIDTWLYLQKASPKDILQLPKFKPQMDLRELGLSDSERKFCGWWANYGSRRPCNVVSKFMSNDVEKFERVKKRVASELHRIRHWDIKLGNGLEIKNRKATWFIDPPYQFGGNIYRCSFCDFRELSIWAETRRGQVIVCENTKADWLPFRPLANNHNFRQRTTESVWVQEII